MNRNNRPGGNGPGIPGNIPGNPVNISTNLRPMPAPTSAKNANGLSLTHCQDLRPPMRGINLECILLEASKAFFFLFFLLGDTDAIHTS